jgi:predicted Rossmann fold nucleotide-binding protein DprA/Smf involved in DNA uptake
MISKQNLMLMGARSRLVEIEQERLQILKMFPELDTTPQPTTSNKTVNYIKSQNKPVSVADIAKHFHISVSAANQRLLEARKKGLVERIKRGYYQ